MKKVLRVSSGSMRGKGLLSPEGRAVRPTSGRVKMSLFNIIRMHLSGASFLDVFSGTGQMGIEAISNGAAGATFVDGDLALTRQNLLRCGCTGQSELLQGSFEAVLTSLAARGRKFDFIFADPPYHEGYYEKLFLFAKPLLSENGVLIAEHDTAQALETELLIKADERVYGSRTLSFFGGNK